MFGRTDRLPSDCGFGHIQFPVALPGVQLLFLTDAVLNPVEAVDLHETGEVVPLDNLERLPSTTLVDRLDDAV